MPIAIDGTAQAQTGLATNTLTVSAPTGTQPGDTVFLVLSHPNQTDSITAPTGFTNIGAVTPSSGDTGGFISIYSGLLSRLGGSGTILYTTSSFQFNFGTSLSAVNCIAFAVANAAYSTPATVNGYNAINNGTSSLNPITTNATVTPTAIPTLPIMVWLAQTAASTLTTPSISPSTWTLIYSSAVASQNQALAVAYGPLTTDTSTAQTAQITWPSGTLTRGASTIFLINQSVPGALTLTPAGGSAGSSFTIPNPGQTVAVQVNQQYSTGAISMTSSNTAAMTVSPATCYGPTDTCTVTGVASGTAAITGVGP